MEELGKSKYDRFPLVEMGLFADATIKVYVKVNEIAAWHKSALTAGKTVVYLNGGEMLEVTNPSEEILAAVKAASK